MTQKEQKYRVNRKVIINTCDVNLKYKKKLEIFSDEALMHKQFDEQEDKRPTAAEEFRKNIYDAIKQEIKDGLRREYDKRRNRDRMNLKIVDSFRMKNGRVRSNNVETGKLKSKVKLPSLGANMYIITTSTKALQKT
jgi:hypothetical protein